MVVECIEVVGSLLGQQQSRKESILLRTGLFLSKPPQTLAPVFVTFQSTGTS